jgi:hypothetical protein
MAFFSVGTYRDLVKEQFTIPMGEDTETPRLALLFANAMGVRETALGMRAPRNCLWGPRTILYPKYIAHKILLGTPDNILGRPNQGGSNKVIFAWRAEKP